MEIVQLGVVFAIHVILEIVAMSQVSIIYVYSYM